MDQSRFQIDDFRRTSILVAEENKYVRSIMTAHFRNIGFLRVQFVDEPPKLDETLRKMRPTVVFYNAKSFEDRGVAMARWIRRDPRSPRQEIPVFVLLDRASPDDIHALRDAGVTEFLLKPVTLARLEDRLAAALLEPRKFVRSPAFVGPCRRRKTMKPEDFDGVLRRIDDPIQVATRTEAENAKLAALEESLEALRGLLAGINPSNPAHVRKVRQSASHAEAVASEVGDRHLQRVSHGLGRYVDAMGANGKLDPKVVTNHIGAMIKLIGIDEDFEDLREQVVEGLRAVVRKKLQAA